MKKMFLGLASLLLIGGLVSCSSKHEDSYTLDIASPGGAPGIAISTLLTDYQDEYKYNIGLEPTALPALFTKKEKDVIIAPINMGAKMYKKNSGYTLGAVVTWGNLYFASQAKNFKLEDINDKELVIFGEGTINESIINNVLENKNITPSKITKLGDAKATQQQLIADNEGSKVFVVAEPSLTMAKLKKDTINSLSIQDLYKEVSGSDGFAQAGCFINVNTINEHKTVVTKFLTRLSDSIDFTKTNASKASENAVALGLFPKADPLIKAIPNCNIMYKSALDSKPAIEGLVKLNAKDFGGAKPEDSFYYEG